MGSLGGFLFVYILGGFTFIPLLLGLLFLYVYLTLPRPSKDAADRKEERHPADIRRPSDDSYSLKSGTDVLAEKFHRAHEGDVAAGYFAVCREYVPGGINGKPPERTTPAGEVISAESPSVYQTMYRSIFDRKQSPSIEPNKGNGKGAKRARNVFYIVLRHGHLMLYDDAEQLEVRYVISLAHHNVSIYAGGEEEIAEPELWIKKNAICLTRKSSIPGSQVPQTSTLPFYLFSDNLSEKEDFYFAILRNLEKIPDSPDTPPEPELFHVDHMVNLVRRLHSSEEHLQTRWINALIGRLFLALYKTEQLEELIWKKISKKISRVKKPSFLTQIALQRVDAGDGAPFITNPRLKDLTIDGDCCVETDIDYSGNFRLQIAATARIDLGSRFKPREVDLVLAVVLKKLKGRLLIRIKPPPSNRIWLSFETMPSMDMAIEPIVSSRQITYGFILRAIESRIREVVAETLVQPFWDDIPFLDTASQRFRGGIWHREVKSSRNAVIPDETGESQEIVGEASGEEATEQRLEKMDEPASAPSVTDSIAQNLSRRSSKSRSSDTALLVSGAEKIRRPEPTANIRARTFSHAADPVLTAGHINVDHTALHTKPRDRDATSEMIRISGRSQTTSPPSSPVGSPSSRPAMVQSKSLHQSSSAQESNDSFLETRPQTQSSSSKMSASPPTPASDRSYSTQHLNSDTAQQEIIAESKKALGSKTLDTRQAVNTIGSAAAAAKRWGWNVFSRADQPSKTADRAVVLDQPMGRGRPLPPPGTPLPPPERSIFSISMPKRKPVPSMSLPDRSQPAEPVRPVSKPPLPKRSSVTSSNVVETSTNDGLLIIEAPCGSEPNSPLQSETFDNVGKQQAVESRVRESELAIDVEKKMV
ncbi:hypothetical protein VTO42DRAFT_1652 [Malbranchea cinnamomea]